MVQIKKTNKKKNGSVFRVTEESADLASQLFEETVELAIEENAIIAVKQFAEFIEEYLPEEILNELKVLAGINNDQISSSGSSTFCFLEDIWIERFQKVDDNAEKADWDRETNTFECELCDRFIQTTRHHVFPKETHDWLKKKDESQYVVSELRKTIALCRMCHSAIHRFYTNRELATDFYSLELLLEDEQVCNFAKWASKLQGRGNLRTK